MSEELKELFDEYETLCGLDTSEQAKICYTQGLRDGIELSIEMDINKVCNDQQDIGNAGTLKEIMDLIVQLNTRNLPRLAAFVRGLLKNQFV